MAKINDDVRAVLDFSPKHKEALLAALEGIDHRDILQAAKALGKRCRELGIPDFPNPFRGVDEDTRDRWAYGFASTYSGDAVAVARTKKTDKDMLDGMTKATIVGYIEEHYGITLKAKSNRPTLIERALAVIRGSY